MRPPRRKVQTGTQRAYGETEKGFLQTIRNLAKHAGWLDYHTFLSIRSPAGFFDLVLVRPPCVLFVEVKTNKGRLSPSQQDWVTVMQQCPAVEVYVWRPRDWDHIAARLTQKADRTP